MSTFPAHPKQAAWCNREGCVPTMRARSETAESLRPRSKESESSDRVDPLARFGGQASSCAAGRLAGHRWLRSRPHVCRDALIVITCVLATSCTAHDVPAQAWKPETADRVQLETPTNWTSSPLPASDPTVRLVLFGPKQNGYPQSHLVVRAGSTATNASLSAAVDAYERIGHVRHTTQTWSQPTAIHVAGARAAVELIGTYRVADRPQGSIVQTLDIFASRDDGIPVHIFAVGSAGQINSSFVQKTANSLTLSK